MFHIYYAGKQDFGSEDPQNAGGAGTHGAGSWYAAPGITKPASLTSKAAAMSATDRLLRRLFAATQLLSVADVRPAHHSK